MDGLAPVAVLVPANLVGALVSFTSPSSTSLAPPRSHEFGGAVRFFAVGFTLLSVLVRLADRWPAPQPGRRPLPDVDGSSPPRAATPYALAGIVFAPGRSPACCSG